MCVSVHVCICLSGGHYANGFSARALFLFFLSSAIGLSARALHGDSARARFLFLCGGHCAFVFSARAPTGDRNANE